MSSTRTLKIDVVADNKKLTRVLKDSETQTTKFAKKLEGFGTGSAVGSRGGLGSASALLKGGGLALGAGVASQKIAELVKAASDLNEQVSKSHVIFGKSADDIDTWSKTTAKAFGISRTEAVQAAATFGSLFTGTGETQASAARLSKTVVNLAGDLASFNDTSTTDALDALRSGLSGEIEPLRRFQVFLTEASVAQRALTETGKTSVQQLTQGEKIQARYALILEQTTKAQGDAARTAGSYANQQRQLIAQSKDLEASLGKVLLPTLTGLVKQLNQGITAAAGFGNALGQVGLDAQGLSDGIGNLFRNNSLKQFTDFVTLIKGGHLVSFGESPSTTLDKIRAATDRANQSAKEFAKSFEKAGDLSFLNPTSQFTLGGKKDAGLIQPGNIDLLHRPQVRNQDGSVSTVKSATFTLDNGQALLLPEVVKDKFGKWIVATAADALKAYKRTGEHLGVFNNEAAANAYAKLLHQQQAAMVKKIPAFGTPGFKVGKAPPVPLGPSVDKRNQFFDNSISRLLDRVKDADLKAQVMKLRAIEQTITARIAVTKDITRKLNLEDELVSVQRQRKSVEQQIGDALQQQLDDAKAARIEAKAKALEALKAKQEAALKKLQGRQFKALGFNAEGGDVIPGVANLKKQLASLTDRLGTEGNLSGKLKTQFDSVGKVLSGSVGKVTEETRAKIEELFATIRSTIDKESGKLKRGPLTKETSLDPNSVLAGIGLTPAAKREIEARLSHFNSAGRGLASRPGTQGAFGVAAGGTITVNTNLIVDGQPLAANTTKHQQRAAQRNPPQKRGRSF